MESDDDDTCHGKHVTEGLVHEITSEEYGTADEDACDPFGAVDMDMTSSAPGGPTVSEEQPKLPPEAAKTLRGHMSGRLTVTFVPNTWKLLRAADGGQVMDKDCQDVDLPDGYKPNPTAERRQYVAGIQCKTPADLVRRLDLNDYYLFRDANGNRRLVTDVSVPKEVLAHGFWFEPSASLLANNALWVKAISRESKTKRNIFATYDKENPGVLPSCLLDARRRSTGGGKKNTATSSATCDRLPPDFREPHGLSNLWESTKFENALKKNTELLENIRTGKVASSDTHAGGGTKRATPKAKAGVRPVVSSAPKTPNGASTNLPETPEQKMAVPARQLASPKKSPVRPPSTPGAAVAKPVPKAAASVAKPAPLKPSAALVKPSAIAGKPSAVPGKPSVVVGKPSAVPAKPSVVVGKPSVVAVGKPSAVARKPFSGGVPAAGAKLPDLGEVGNPVSAILGVKRTSDAKVPDKKRAAMEPGEFEHWIDVALANLFKNIVARGNLEKAMQTFIKPETECTQGFKTDKEAGSNEPFKEEYMGLMWHVYKNYVLPYEETTPSLSFDIKASRPSAALSIIHAEHRKDVVARKLDQRALNSTSPLMAAPESPEQLTQKARSALPFWKTHAIPIALILHRDLFSKMGEQYASGAAFSFPALPM